MLHLTQKPDVLFVFSAVDFLAQLCAGVTKACDVFFVGTEEDEQGLNNKMNKVHLRPTHLTVWLVIHILQCIANGREREETRRLPRGTLILGDFSFFN